MYARDPGEAFTLIMDERNWSQVRLGRELGVDQTWVSRLVRGASDPGMRKISALLAKVGWEVRIAPKSEQDDPVKRREFITGTASALFIPSPKTTPFHDPRYVDLLTQRMAQIHYCHGDNSQATTLIDQARKVCSAAINGDRRLQLAATDFMRYGSYVLHGAGRADIGAQFAKNALRLATQTEDPDKQAQGCFALGLVGVFHGYDSSFNAPTKSVSNAIALAQRGLQIPGIGDEPRAYLNTLLAGALANVPGNERRARVVIDRALSIDTIAAADRADIVGMAGNIIRETGARREALAMLADASRLNSTYSPYLQARYLGDQIGIALDMREPSQAASLMNTLSYIVPMVDSTRLVRQVDQIGRITRPWSAVPEIRDARERLQSVQTMPPPRPGHERP